jgi:hypothetical protein
LLTRKILPPCSVIGCDHAAGAIMDGALYCGAHAANKLKSKLAARNSGERPPAAA